MGIVMSSLFREIITMGKYTNLVDLKYSYVWGDLTRFLKHCLRRVNNLNKLQIMDTCSG